MVKVAPSILSADFCCLSEEIKKVENGGADLLHIDVMDGHFVPNITLGPPVISSLKGKTYLPFDVHLMIENPEKHIDDFIKAGADIITVHVESTVHLNRLVNYIKNKGIKPGVALNPSTPLSSLQYILDDIYMILIMSVNPGFGGQKFIPKMLEKIRDLKRVILQENPEILIEVDGGINEENAPDIIKAGADILVAGSAIYLSSNPGDVIEKLKTAH
ncbi:ribulose-5-phosphate 3-epimerase [Tepidanaerobacter acetatoxydans Re1]|uniref:Ribulose-phosphate 3-epimerase n=1 Tax=Tepidanaerobacter acetatoxydans (strain DSM 21804 / JCM 16047 / Re1) TaxID=1209989 RepID=F4LVM1_TEPAE|nr:ribulose-phosphate 3-epimerase [Tepidanaerobacter acetatoxydans]AEE91607.1 ribulose-phosphate 3-epimerase [Tepidanaerobacter acetatoxydans Re1]CDI40743.1 ribulose-5-phosphate 3-epimerase [Tepidanaerobacter acetatoxydans Re1]